MIKLIFKNQFILKYLKLIHTVYWKLIIQVWKFKSNNYGEERANISYSIGIVTYFDRYDNFFKPLITNLITIFPDTEFIIAINGYYNKVVQEKYLKDINIFLSKFKNVKIVDFTEAQSLSKLWNLLILNSSCTKTLILNDDILISTKFRKNLEETNFLSEEIGLINRSWSHFIISKKIISQVGWFDERFPGVGNEDEDYECRLIFKDIEVKTYIVKGLKNIVFLTKNFSYGKNISTEAVKYVRKNKIFFDSKWNVSKKKLPSFRYVGILQAYAKLRDGMNTPNFYELNLLNSKNTNILK